MACAHALCFCYLLSLPESLKLFGFFQMSFLEITVLGVVYDTPCVDEVLNRLKALAFDHLPDGWRDWPLTSVDEPTFDIDQQCLNKLRFALPTVGIAIAFSPRRLRLFPRRRIET